MTNMTMEQFFEEKAKKVFEEKMEKLEWERTERYLQRVKNITGQEWNPFDELMGNYDFISKI